MKKEYRDDIEVRYDILKVCDDPDENKPTIISFISRTANVSHYLAVEHINVLGECGLIDSYRHYLTEYDHNNDGTYKIAFRTTLKGKEFLRAYEGLENSLTKVRDFDYKQAPENDKSRNN